MEESSPAVSRSGSLPPGVGTPEESRPPPSPLSGAYLLVIISEPQTDAHKAIILQKLAKAKANNTLPKGNKNNLRRQTGRKEVISFEIRRINEFSGYLPSP
ncbi:hypothetical protein V9T40_011158 [Parthenolecanium corni]|uniref:Uncharacterized protein n=1 Tax=Parthenolecanium corni TaxID=536013 RepID=A0AAN9TI45_9HEMI